jgi:adenylate kinase
LLHLSTGDLLRAAVAEGTPLGQAARRHMDKGELVPDHLVIALLRSRLAGAGAYAGFLLDGFPRTVAQAEALEADLGDEGVEHVVHLELDDEEILRRLLQRGRKDDTADVVRKRLAVYRAETRPLVAWYADRGLLRTVDARGTVEEVEDRIAAALPAPRASTGEGPWRAKTS